MGPRKQRRKPPVATIPARGQVTAAQEGTVAAVLRAAFPDQSWAQVRRLCLTGKIAVRGEVRMDPALHLRVGTEVDWDMTRPDPSRAALPDFKIVFEDSQIIVIDKPQGISSVPYDRHETNTALDHIRKIWRAQGRQATAQPLFTVHRIDKDTSGLLCFAKTKLSERGMHRVFKNHLADRMYFAVAHGDVAPGRIESVICPDRGDGIRGTNRRSNDGQLSVTHVFVDQRLRGATLCKIRLETGRTHQIRIHLSERGHPLVGETVYIRDLRRDGGHEIPSRRLLLHAATLGFEHPVNGQRLFFESPLPPDFRSGLSALHVG
ncbi:MAG: RluA family pseudouridine synthase [Deltaproteobacteria bacterium]|nr:RluA family pseudouridine synthase [Deltaproteobacteria bacterium]